VAQLDDVHSVLRLNYETLRGLISLPSPSVAKPTLCGATNASFREGRPAQVGHQPYPHFASTAPAFAIILLDCRSMATLIDLEHRHDHHTNRNYG
jgi:hypothetical protein